MPPLSDELILGLLAKDSSSRADNAAILEYFNEHPDLAERSAFCKHCYKQIYTYLFVDDHTVGFIRHDMYLELWEGNYLTKTAQVNLTWDAVAAKIADLISFTVLPTGEIQTVVMKDAREDTPTPTPDNTPTPDHTPQPTPNTTPAPTSVPAAPTATPAPQPIIPKTGDNSPLGLLLAIAGISLAGLAVLVYKSARRKDIAPRDDDDEVTED